MAAVSDYSKLKKKIQGVEKLNKTARNNAVKWCRIGRSKAEALVTLVEQDAAKIKSMRDEIDKLYLKWEPVTEILAELQIDLKKARKKKAEAEIKELLAKIKSSEKEYGKLSAAMKKLYDKVIPLEHKLSSLGENIKKV